MRSRRALTVRIVAASGVAAVVVGLMIPSPRLWAQKPEEGPALPLTLPPVAEKTGDAPPAVVPVATDPPPFPDPGPNPLPPARPAPASSSKGATADASSPFTPEGTLADPEGEAKAFVEKSQKDADEVIRALNKEAETLRARLQKVEAGLARWQAVKESLAATGAGRPAWRPGAVVPGPVIQGPAAAPAEGFPPMILEPLPPAGVDPKARPATPAGPATSPETVKPPAAPDAGRSS